MYSPDLYLESLCQSRCFICTPMLFIIVIYTLAVFIYMNIVSNDALYMLYQFDWFSMDFARFKIHVLME